MVSKITLIRRRQFRDRLSHIDKVVVGACGFIEPGWIGLERDDLDLLRPEDFSALFRFGSLNVILAEHVWEHLTEEEGLNAAMNCGPYLSSGGRLRIAVPDGFHPSPSYIESVRPDGSGIGAKDHKVLYDHESISDLLERAGYKVELLEFFTKAGEFRSTPWDVRLGKVRRSLALDSRNAGDQVKYTSLIVDAFPLKGSHDAKERALAPATKTISFCTTCRDRCFQSEAFLRNLFVAQPWEGCEFVLIDYGSSDGLRDFIRKLPVHLSRNLKYYRTEAIRFHMSHAKNVAHLAASGEILMNLDFDNYLHQDHADFVRSVVKEGCILHNTSRHHRGTCGRIAMMRSDFILLRGYDESFAPFRFQDIDLLCRADARNMKILSNYPYLPVRSTAIMNEIPAASIDHERDMEQRSADEAENRIKGADRLRVVNPNGFGAAELVDLDGQRKILGA